VTYTLQDAAGAQSTGTVSVLIQGHDQAPVAIDDKVSVEAANPTTLSTLLANDSDPDAGDGLHIQGLPAHTAAGASLSLDAEGNVIYDPGSAFTGLAPGGTASDSFTYTVVDSHGLASQATAHVTVSGSALPEDALTLVRFLAQDESTENLYDQILSQAQDALGEPVTLVSIDTTGMEGTAHLDGTSLVYTADGADLEALWGDEEVDIGFDFTVRTASGALHVGRVDVTVNGYNDDPVAGADQATVSAGGATGNLWDVLLANDHDVDLGQTLTIESVDATGAAGRLTIDLAHHEIVYHADTSALAGLPAGQTVHDHFTYELADGVGGHATGVVDVTVQGSASLTSASGWLVA
jgi:VCBS repeat-containing protein